MVLALRPRRKPPSCTTMKLVNVFDYESRAEMRMAPGAWEYFARGSDDEVTLRANRRAFEQVRLHPCMLVDA